MTKEEFRDREHDVKTGPSRDMNYIAEAILLLAEVIRDGLEDLKK